MSMYRQIRSRLFASLCALSALLATSPAAQASDTLAKIKKSGKGTVGTEAAFPPFEFVQDGKIVGYDKDILDHIVASLSVKLDQVDTPWQGLFPGLLAGKFDFIASAMTM